ncbi:MAG TPA: hypothetical protein VGW36_04750, partial [Pyrinomonadaceae bacterium]|nr:hypothetical protein [Pyrinomonadaceae bacterium]
MKLFCLLTLLLLMAPAAIGQSLPPTFSVQKNTNQENSTDYVLRPVLEEVHKKAGGSDKPYRLLFALVRPGKASAVLMFANAHSEPQLSTQSDNSVKVKADSLELS